MATHKDYKFWYIKRDGGFITEAAIRFYEGEYKDVVNEYDKKTINRYIRTKKIDTKIFTSTDFGKIKTDDELRKFLNKGLNKITGLTAVLEQKWQK